MEDLLATQQQIINEVERLSINFGKDGSERKTPQYAKKKLETLTALCAEFENNHKKLGQYESSSAHAYFKDYYYDGFTKMAKEFQGKIQPFLVEDKPMLKPASPGLARSFDWPQAAGARTPQVQQPPQAPQRTANIDQYQGSSGQSSASKADRGNTTKLDEMLRKQKSNFKALARAIYSIDASSLSEKWEFEDALNTIKGRWSVVDTLHWEIDSELINDNPQYEKTYYEYEEKYNIIKKSINSSMWSARHREKSTPAMEIPVFHGNYHQWVSFKDLFTETIHTNKSLSNSQKMQYLKSKVKGPAEKLIQHLNISQDNYDTCWEILNQRYDNKKLILNSHLNILLSIPNMQQQSSSAIKKLLDTTNECLYAIKNLGVDISHWDPLIIYLLSQKLDADTHNDYVEYVQDPKDIPVLSDFLKFLDSKFTALEASRRGRGEQSKLSQSSQQQESNKKSNYQKSDYKPFNNSYNFQSNKKSFYVATQKCPQCNSQHGLFHCKIFTDLKPTDKLKTVTKFNLCKNCLYDHKGKACFSEKRCQQCQSNHNTLLHEAYENEPQLGQSSKRNVTHVSGDNLAEIILATAQIQVEAEDGSIIKMRALIDQGSQTSLITENAAQRLGLARQRCKGVIFGIGTKENNCKGVIRITAKSMYSDYTFSTDVLIMKNLINNLPNRSFEKPTWSYLEGIQLADPDFNISRPVDILLGADIYSNIILGGLIREGDLTPIVQQSRLGWIICGNMKSYQCNVVINNIEEISKFWEIEDIAESSAVNMSTEDHYCLQQYKTETKRQEDGRYVVRLPLKPEIKEKLGESKQKAIAQFYQLEKKFQKHENIAKDYKQFINEYQQLGHMRPCASNLTPSYYLPHHCVLRAESTTTKLRVVFNASSKTLSGYSLNDLMYSGPNLQADLLSLILRWRQYKIAFTSDIEKMFRQLLCHTEDQKYQKLIWRDEEDQPLKEWTLTTVTYGTKAAPFLAMMTLKRLALDECQRYPEASRILDRDFYMDDLISGAHSIQSAKQIISNLIALLKSGGFNLRKWSSNERALLDQQESEDNITSSSFDFKHQESTKALGLRWDPRQDVFTFQLKIDTTSSKPATKRSLLSEISTIFDPLGWLCPVTTKLKLLFQLVWQQNIQWDEKIPTSLNDEWLNIKKNLTEINTLQIQRWLESQENDSIELHGFCDASESAYACVIYSKIKNTEKTVIIAAKSRLVPKKKSVSLPRLELCAALLLSNLMNIVQKNLSGYNIDTYGWSDSTAVLGWINGDPNRWKPFVSNRVHKIKEIIPAKQWQYIKSAENPADCASRGITASQLKEHKLWWNGPAVLFDLKNGQAVVYDTNQEVKNYYQTNVATQHRGGDVIRELINKHSCLTRLTRIVAWLYRVSSFNRHRRHPRYLTALEIKTAKIKIIKFVQQESFSEEINALQQQKKLKSTSKLLSLNPYLDQDELLRVGGRISNANISENMKHPFIIPHNHHFTDIFIDQAHKMTLHGGARLTLTHLRQEVWIIGGIRAVKKRIHNCVTCRKHEPIKLKQIMGDLPSARCNPTRPFYHTGVDLTGFISVKANIGRGIKTTKGYVVVFVCMATKAIHLELVSDLSSTAFLSALRRMAARRGTPRHIYSDNGTNFVGANKRLDQEIINLKSTLDQNFFSTVAEMQIEWHFNAPSWPSAGGLWESAVKSLKHHFRRVIGEQNLTFEELSTLLAQIEGCLNTRPLCALREDPDDINCLTPSHFLSSGPVLTIVETETDQRTRWQLVQKIFKDIWKRWQAEYLCQLSNRSKWQHAESNIEVNDIVIIHDANVPAGKWAMGRVVELHPGKDGYVRVVTLKTKNGTMKRPIVKLSKLPVNEPAKVEHQDQEKPSKENEERTSKKSKTKATKASIVMGLLMLTMMLIVSPVQCDYKLSNINNNQSIYFDKLSNMHLVRDEWKLVVYYDMEPYWQGLKLFSKYINHIESMCSMTTKQTHRDVVLLQLRHGFQELEYYNSLMLGNQMARAVTRRRRGLINGIGYLAHSLFGVLDEHFAQQYEQDINIIKSNQKHMALLWKNQTSVVESEYNLLRRVQQSMNNQHKLFNQQLITLEKNSNTLSQQIEVIANNNDFALSSIIANSILTNLKSIQETLVDTITDIHYGKFNIHLLTPEQLRNELNIISGQLSKDLTIPIDNVQTKLSNIYHLLKVKARMTNLYFLFEIKIPLITRDSYDIYKLIPIPQQHGKHMIVISPIAEFVALNLQKDSYITLSENEIQSCLLYDSSTRLCPLQRPIYHMTSDDNLCVMDKTSDQCKTYTQGCAATWSELSQLNTYLYFVCDLQTIRIICEHRVTAVQVSKAGIMTLGDGCVIKGEGYEIYAHNRQTNELRTRPDIIQIEIPPINNIINLSIPINMTDSQSFESQKYEKDLQNIGTQIETLKSAETNTEPSDLSQHDLHQFVVLYLAVGAGLVAVALYACRRGRLRCSARITPAPAPPAPVPAPRSERSTSMSVHYTANPEPVALNESARNPNSVNATTSPIFISRFIKSEVQ